MHYSLWHLCAFEHLNAVVLSLGSILQMFHIFILPSPGEHLNVTHIQSSYSSLMLITEHR